MPMKLVYSLIIAMQVFPAIAQQPDKSTLLLSDKYQFSAPPGNIDMSLGQGIIIIIHPDGRIERGPGFTTTDKASLAFWKAIDRTYPEFLHCGK